MKKIIPMKAIGIIVTIIGFGVNILSDWVDEKKQEEIIKEEVQKAIRKEENRAK